MRTVLVVLLLFVLHVSPAVGQEVQTCWESVLVACEATEASPVCYDTKLVPCKTPTDPRVAPLAPPATRSVTAVEHPRSRTLFWTGLGLVGAGTTLAVLSTTALQRSDPNAPASALPCGTDPVVARRYAIAPCVTNGPLLATGVAVAGGGALLTFWASRPVAVVISPQMTGLRVRF